MSAALRIGTFLLAAVAMIAVSFSGGRAQDPAGKGVFDTPVPGVPNPGEPAKKDAPPFGEPGDKDDAPVIRYFTHRTLKLANNLPEKVTVFVQYRAYENGAWAWKPDLPQAGKSLSFVIEPNSEIVVDQENQPVNASRIRLWAMSDGGLRWNRYKDKDLWVVPEIENEEHRYLAAAMETFTYTFQGPQVLLATPQAAGEQPGVIGANPPAIGEQPGVIAGSSPVQQFQPNPVFIETVTPTPQQAPIFNPIVQGPVNIPQPPILLTPPTIIVNQLPPQEQINPFVQPNLPQPPPQPIERQSDLAVSSFPVSEDGSYTGVIINNGPAPYSGDRRYRVFTSSNGVDRTVAEAAIPPLNVGRAISFNGKIGNVLAGTNVTLALSPGDTKPFNDIQGITLAAPTRADLSVQVQLDGNTLRGTITNNGPGPFEPGKRRYTLGDALNIVTPSTGLVDRLAAGQSQTVTLDVSKAATTRNRFFMQLNRGDTNPSNDTATVVSQGPAAGGDADLAVNAEVVQDPASRALTLKGVVRNVGKGDYTGNRQVQMSYIAGPSYRRDMPAALVPALAAGASKEFTLALDRAPALTATTRINLNVFDSNPSNDEEVKSYTPATTAAGVPVLVAQSLTLAGKTLTGTIRNDSAVDFKGGKLRYIIGDVNGNPRIVRLIPPLAAGASTTVTFDLPALPTNATTYRLLLEVVSPRNAATFNFFPSAPPVPTPPVVAQPQPAPAQPVGADLKVSLTAANGIASIAVDNIGVNKSSAGRTLTLYHLTPNRTLRTVIDTWKLTALAPRDKQFLTKPVPNSGELFAVIAPETGDPTANDTATVKLDPAGAPATPVTPPVLNPQLAKADLAISGTIDNDVLRVSIVNKGAAPSIANGYVIETGGRGLGNGTVPAMQPNSVINLTPLQLAPTATPVTVTARLTAPDGGQPDQVAIVQPAAAVISNADLQVTINANNGIAAATVTNIGKSPSSAGRTFTLRQLTPIGVYGKLTGLNGKFLEPATLPALPPGGKIEMIGKYTGRTGELSATVSPEAGDPAENNIAKVIPGAGTGTDPVTPPMTDPQVAKADLTVTATINNNVLSVVIANKGTAPSGPNTYVIEAGGRGLGNGQVPALQPNQTVNITPLTLAPTATPVNVAVRLTNPDGGQPDQVALVQPAAAVISKADLKVTIVVDGGTAIATVTNIGQSPSAPGRTFSLRQITPRGVYGKLSGLAGGFLEPAIIPGLAAGSKFNLMGKYTGTGELVANVSPEAGDPAENDIAKVVPGAAPTQPVDPPVTVGGKSATITATNHTKFPANLFGLDAARREILIGRILPGQSATIGNIKVGTQLGYRLEGSPETGGATVVDQPQQTVHIGNPRQPGQPVIPLIDNPNQGGAQLSQIEQRLVQLVNAERAKNNLRPLTVNPNLMVAARGHSANQARQKKMDHILDGKNPLDRMNAAGYRPNLWLENVFWGRDTPEEAMQWWMNSPIHRNNILNPNITEIGVGVQNSYWTQAFGRQQ